MSSPRKKRPAAGRNPVWDEVIADLGELAEAIRTGGPAAARKKFTVRRVRVASPPSVSAAEIKAVRESLGASQAVFAHFLGVSAPLVRSWEQGRKAPTPIARRLLADMRDNRAYWRARVAEAVVPAAAR
jgi:putative transcriptional regulator